MFHHLDFKRDSKPECVGYCGQQPVIVSATVTETGAATIEGDAWHDDEPDAGGRNGLCIGSRFRNPMPVWGQNGVRAYFVDRELLPFDPWQPRLFALLPGGLHEGPGVDLGSKGGVEENDAGVPPLSKPLDMPRNQTGPLLPFGAWHGIAKGPKMPAQRILHVRHMKPAALKVRMERNGFTGTLVCRGFNPGGTCLFLRSPRS